MACVMKVRYIFVREMLEFYDGQATEVGGLIVTDALFPPIVAIMRHIIPSGEDERLFCNTDTPNVRSSDAPGSLVLVEYVCVSTQEGSLAPVRTPTHCNLIRHSITPSATSVIAQHYSSATFVSPRLHSRKEKFDAP
jgi:hypothetical protein